MTDRDLIHRLLRLAENLNRTNRKESARTVMLAIGRLDTKAAGRRGGPTWFWWAIHNMVAHPASEVLYWVGLGRFGNWLHDATVPIHEAGQGRG